MKPAEHPTARRRHPFSVFPLSPAHPGTGDAARWQPALCPAQRLCGSGRHHKPDVLTAADIPTRIWPLAAKKINGIGPKAASRLERLGIVSIGDLAQTPVETLVRYFGLTTGQWLHRAAHGIDDRPVVTTSEPKSISRESTFERDLHPKTDRAALSGILIDLCARVADDLKRKGYACRTVGIKLRFSDFQVVMRDTTLPACLSSADDLLYAARSCLKRVTIDQRIRLLGVRTSGLVLLSDTAAAQNSPVQGQLDF